MPMPSFSNLLSPMLELLGDGLERDMNDVVDQLATVVQLAANDRALTLKSGESLFANRVWWARTYLVKAALVASPARRKIRITGDGKAFLAEHHSALDVQALLSIPVFREWYYAPSRRPGGPPPQDALGGRTSNELTPEERFEASHRELQEAFRQELLERVNQCSASQFEKLVVKLLVAMGYGGSIEDAAQIIGRSGDGGIDALINQDRLGLDVVYIQAKRWKGVVGEPMIRDFVGGLVGRHAKKGVFITTSDFTKEARHYVKGLEHKVVLMDGLEFARYMIECGVGASLKGEYALYRVDSDGFDNL